MAARKHWLWALTLAAMTAPLRGAGGDVTKLPPALSRTIDYSQDIQPLFERSCYSCHGPDKRKGGLRLDDKDSALRGGDTYAPDIQPGQSADSPLIHLVAGLVPDVRMPPKGEPLTAEEIGTLRTWIDQGAAWPDIGPEKIHWALQPVRRPATSPEMQRAAGSSNPIDAFLTAKLRENKLAASRPADARTLIRRLYFDLLGLPPSPEEVNTFVSDKRPGAYSKLVARLLASPHYGERWGRHWLDAVRFAETHGFEMNQPRPNAWPYRDYVIRAFNADKPYDQFILEQVAGDALEAEEATGFLVAGPWDQVKSPDPVLTANQRADELHDLISTTGSTFLGLTVGCARCHHHKFDPIPQTDYYAMKAVFEGVQHGERPLRLPQEGAREAKLEQSRGRLAEVERQLEEFEPVAQVQTIQTNSLRSPVNAHRNVERFRAVTAQRLRFTVGKTSDAEPCVDELEVYTAETVPRNIALASEGAKASASSVFPNSNLHRLEHINDGQHGNSRSWISNERGQGWVELEFHRSTAINKVVWGRDREQRFTDRLALEYRIEVARGSNDWQAVASSADRRSYVAGEKHPSSADFPGLSETEASHARELARARSELTMLITELAKAPMIYGGSFVAEPEATRRFQRGDPMQKREPVPPGAPGAVPIRFSLEDDTLSSTSSKRTPEQQRRLALGRWLVHPENPLTARVMVNRIWQHHFGAGLVGTPSDFGVNGARPTHPELLDWLAAEFMQHGWSVKHIHRLIVDSAAYRQTSAARADGLAVDAASRLLWRFPSRRLEAEPIRDSILAVSGKLALGAGGPGFSFFEANDNYVRVYVPRREWSDDTFRRMVYGTVVRQRPDGVFGAFDCPDAGQIAPKRSRSTTPLQALNLLNSSFMMQQAEFFAARLVAEAGRAPEAQVRRAFALAFQREPDGEENAASQKLVREHGAGRFCRALFNANEFVYVY